MRVAAIYDIHGNLPALEAVLAEVRRADVDRIVVGGDVLPGPMPRETLALLADLEIPTELIMGNGEVAVLAERAGRDIGHLPEQAQESVRWTAEQLRPDDERWLASWPKTLRLAIQGLGEALFCHATPRNETECFTRLTPEERLLPVFAGAGVPLVVCGHTHMQFDRMVGGTRVVNAGSVGMPFGEPGADWLLLGPGVELRHTPYDLAAAARSIRRTAYPQAEDFAARNILSPPSEGEMLELFTRVEIK
jgi:predicted phosphodiesterase